MLTRTAFRQRTLAPHISPFSTASYTTASPRIEPDSGDAVARPATVPWSEHLHNSVSFTGTVEYPLKQFTFKNGQLGAGATTMLLIKPRPTSTRYFRIKLSFWNLLAERALACLKPNDYICVSGQLGSYTKSTLEGTERLYYKVTANEINYVQVPDESYLAESGEEIGGKSKKRLLLLQSFFANPDEWYDDRNTKKSWKRPDFIHKRTDEAIWLNSDDPHWVKKKLKIIDSRLKGTPSDEVPFSSSTSDLSGECLEQKHKRRLPLWQSLFANPDEWYDYRKTKKHWKHPDFRHKKTDEALWLNVDDPSWVKEHVKLLDSGLSETRGGEMPFGSPF